MRDANKNSVNPSQAGMEFNDGVNTTIKVLPGDGDESPRLEIGGNVNTGATSVLVITKNSLNYKDDDNDVNSEIPRKGGTGFLVKEVNGFSADERGYIITEEINETNEPLTELFLLSIIDEKKLLHTIICPFIENGALKYQKVSKSNWLITSCELIGTRPIDR